MAAGHEGAARQVVWALRNCGPDIPWHRVLGAGGKILLPGEAGLEQRIRLEAEGVRFVGSRVQPCTGEKGRRASLRAPSK
jgi:alkylated DNA nucleotide flippase Atl1